MFWTIGLEINPDLKLNHLYEGEQEINYGKVIILKENIYSLMPFNFLATGYFYLKNKPDYSADPLPNCL